MPLKSQLLSLSYLSSHNTSKGKLQTFSTSCIPYFSQVNKPSSNQAYNQYSNIVFMTRQEGERDYLLRVMLQGDIR